jgi:hypothetical protein
MIALGLISHKSDFYHLLYGIFALRAVILCCTLENSTIGTKLMEAEPEDLIGITMLFLMAKETPR